MGIATVTREIERLDALSRTRELSPRESMDLQKMLRIQRGYRDRSAADRRNYAAAAARRADSQTSRGNQP